MKHSTYIVIVAAICVWLLVTSWHIWKHIRWSTRVKRANDKVLKALKALEVGIPQDRFDFLSDQCDAALEELKRELGSK